MIRYPYSRVVVMALCPGNNHPTPLFGDSPSTSASRMHKLVPGWRDRALGVNAWRTKGAYERREPSRVREIVRDTGCSTVIALGRDVQHELGIYDAPHLAWVLTKVGSREISVLALPHPSGLNRWWNDPANVRRARIALREALDNSLRV